ncbi:transglycosylase domain-containing protein [Cognatilysobacter segetis]|uniref:transglycosylase domain-containing protein n=1 Tax=Cognatilysobacter segetis TaxID=2492394 RepID=UPI00138FCDAB|nr:PBP1A family penicillin-binding protein [Lysobacter segetis]
MLKMPFDEDGDAPASDPSAPASTTAPIPFLQRRLVRIGLVALGVLVLLLAWAAWRLPLNRALEPLPDPTLVLVDRNGVDFARRGAVKEPPVDVTTLPPHVAGAVVAIEDRRFYHHLGIDPRGVARAMARNWRAGGVKQGGSTITQQLAKTAFLEPDRTIRRKIREALIAVYLEARLSKDEILSRYLSSIYFGDGVYGLRGAAHHYFGKEPEKLSIGESAMLAGMIKAPSALSPTHDRKAALKRMRVVLKAMADAGVISEGEAKRVRDPRVLASSERLTGGTWFADWVAPQAREAFDADYGEIRVRTTLDARMQKLAQRLVRHWLGGEGRRVGATQAALVAMTPNGEVLALVGGRDYAKSQFDRATQARRQPGSAFKLFTYYAALRSGATPDTLIDDAPLKLGTWSPSNYDGRYAGPIPLRDAFARSSNVAAVRLAQQVGPHSVVQAARDLGVASPLGTDPSIALGTYEVTLLELTSAYAAFAQGAAPVTPHGLPGAPVGPSTPIDPDLRAMMLDMLWQVVDRGTGRAARLGDMPAFGKTGTTQEHRDALFVGMAGDLVVGVWVGNDDGTPMKRVTGGSLPARIWRDFMKGAVRIAPSAGPMLRPQRALPPPVAMPDDSMFGGEGEVLPEPVEDVSALPPEDADAPVEVIDVPIPVDAPEDAPPADAPPPEPEPADEDEQ